MLLDSDHQDSSSATESQVTPPAERTSSSAADEINREHNLAIEAAEEAIAHACRCGELLIEQKRRSGHGRFQEWVRDHCEFSHDSANAYMRAARAKTSGLVFSSLRELITRERAEKKCRIEHVPMFTRPNPKDFDLPENIDPKTWGAAREVMQLMHNFAVAIRDLDALSLCRATVTQDLDRVRPSLRRILNFVETFMDVSTGANIQGRTPSQQVDAIFKRRDAKQIHRRMQCPHCGHPTKGASHRSWTRPGGE